MTRQSHFSGISGSTLKLIAVFSMLVDHTGATVLRTLCHLPSITAVPGRQAFFVSAYNLSRSIGRIAFPIFCFLLVEGFLHTRSAAKYAFRMLLFAVVSEIPFDLALKGAWYYPEKQNVYVTLLIALLVLIGFRLAEQFFSGSTPKKLLRFLLYILILSAGMQLSILLNTDYNFKGVFLIAILYLMRQSTTVQCIGGACSVAWELPAPAAFLPIWLYNGTRGLKMKYFFYLFYPVHLLLLYLLNTVVAAHG